VDVIGIDPLQVKGEQAIKKAAAASPQRRIQQATGPGQRCLPSHSGQGQADGACHQGRDQGPADRAQPQLGALLARELARWLA
jgi:hypothetical protein